jgi:hypothetical protein
MRFEVPTAVSMKIYIPRDLNLHVRIICKCSLSLLDLFIFVLPVTTGGQDSAVSIATRYGLDGSGIKSWWRRNFLRPSGLALGPTQPPIQWVLGLSQGLSGRDVALTTYPLLAPRFKEE